MIMWFIDDHTKVAGPMTMTMRVRDKSVGRLKDRWLLLLSRRYGLNEGVPKIVIATV